MKLQNARKAYQLSKSRNTYWWTGTIETDNIPTEDEKYKWVLDKKTAQSLSGTKIRMKIATIALLIAFAMNTTQANAQELTTAAQDSTTGSSIRWEGRKFETIYRTPSGALFLARTKRGVYYRKFIKEEPTTHETQTEQANIGAGSTGILC
jgi:hypothetical protein